MLFANLVDKRCAKRLLPVYNLIHLHIHVLKPTYAVQGFDCTNFIQKNAHAKFCIYHLGILAYVSLWWFSIVGAAMHLFIQ